jgi:Flp pilus assembly pilin Flp
MLNLFTFIQARLAILKANAEEGATATEYALLVTLIALGLVATVTAYKTFLAGKFNSVTW